MAWRARWSTLIEKIKPVYSVEERNALLNGYASCKTARVVAFVNAHAMNSIVADRLFYDALCSSDDILLDGSGMSMLYQNIGRTPGLNMNGTDFIPMVLSSFRGRSVALWGTINPYLMIAAERCESDFGNRVVSTENGFHALAHYVELAKRLQPDLIVLGMGMPKQECLAQAIRQSGEVNSVIVCGGAIIDFISGRSTRAPKWMRTLGIEWVYRLILEPRRLFKRYIVGNPLFLFRVWMWKHGKSD